MCIIRGSSTVELLRIKRRLWIERDRKKRTTTTTMGTDCKECFNLPNRCDCLYLMSSHASFTARDLYPSVSRDLSIKCIAAIATFTQKWHWLIAKQSSTFFEVFLNGNRTKFLDCWLTTRSIKNNIPWPVPLLGLWRRRRRSDRNDDLKIRIKSLIFNYSVC